MKAGLADRRHGHARADRVAELPEASRPRVTLLATTDEEVGSATSRAADRSDWRASSAAVLVLEPALPGGARQDRAQRRR